ncbi:hypothetical protein SCYAM73S_01946 [Streptomyces cyaneofuscatus]
MDQLPPDSHWATAASHSDAVAAEALPAAISGAATAAPVTPATEMTRVALDGRRCLPLPENSMVDPLTDACEVSCRVRAG